MRHVRTHKKNLAPQIAVGVVIFLLTFFGMSLVMGQVNAEAPSVGNSERCPLNPAVLVPGMQGIAAAEKAGREAGLRARASIEGTCP